MKTMAIAAGALLVGAWLSLASAGPQDEPAEKKPVMILGTGGSGQNINDVAWVLTTDTYVDPKTKKSIERKVLLCYRVGSNGKLVDIVDVRDITWDAKFKQLPIDGHNANFSPDKMYKAWLEQQRRAAEGD